MPFEPGQSGNTAGRPTGSKAKPWCDALRLAVFRLHDDLHAEPPQKPRVLDALAHALVKKALDGDVPALKEIADRLDGRPIQQLEHTGEDGGPIETTNVPPRELARRLLFAVAAADHQETRH